MGVGEDLVDLVLLAVVVAPDMTEADKEELLGGEVEVLDRKHVLLVTPVTEGGVVSSLKTAVVRDVLSQRAPAVEVDARQAEVAVLLHQAGHVLPVLGQGLLRPPRLQVSGSVVLPPVVVKGVTELVADGEPDTSEIEKVWPGALVEGRSEDAERKDDLIHEGGVVGVNGLR